MKECSWSEAAKTKSGLAFTTKASRDSILINSESYSKKLAGSILKSLRSNEPQNQVIVCAIWGIDLTIKSIVVSSTR